MKKLLGLLSVVFLTLILIGGAQALPFSETFNADVWFNGNNTSHTWTFNLDSDSLQVGDINAEDTITSATLTLRFFDDAWPNDGWLFQEAEYASGTIDGSTWFSNWEVGDQDRSANVLASLNDHILSVTVNRISGDFGVDFTRLSGQYTDNPPVPEPATMALFGLGLLGLAGVSRRKK